MISKYENGHPVQCSSIYAPYTERLSKIAGDLGRSPGSLIEYLQKKGIEFDASKGANAKISHEIHEILLNEFSSDKALKDQAVKRNEDKFVKSEIITAPEKKTIPVIEKEEDNIDEILQHSKQQMLDIELKAKKKKADRKRVAEKRGRITGKKSGRTQRT